METLALPAPEETADEVETLDFELLPPEDFGRDPLDITPDEFAEDILGDTLYPWQRRILHDLDEPGWFTIRAANESGKTSKVASRFIGWFFTAYPTGRLISTAGVYRQVTDQLWPKVKQLGQRLGWEVQASTLDTPQGGFARGFRAIDPELFEGYHGDDEFSPLAIIVDEAKSVADDIFTAIARCRPHWLILMSSAGEAKGEFYKSQTSQRRFYVGADGRPHVYKVTAYDCPHISRDALAKEIEKWGREHWLVKSMIFSEFTRAEEAGAIVQLSDIERAIHRPPAYKPDAGVNAFCDFAAGGAQNVLAIRRGNRVAIVAAWRERDTTIARDAFIQLFERHELKPEQITGDNSGLGIPIIDALHEKGWPINRFNGGATAYNSTRFHDRNAEIWNEFAAGVRASKWVIVDETEPDGETLISQCSGRKGRRDSSGRLQVESKEQMAARGLESPDKADAAIGAACETTAGFFGELL